MTVIKCSSYRAARQLAFDEGLRHGHSFKVPGWYVGTAEELEEVGATPEPIPRVWRVWGSVAFYTNVEADSSEQAIQRALDPEYAYAGSQEQEWTPCDDPPRPDSLGYIYECVPCLDNGEPTPVVPAEEQVLSASMRNLAIEMSITMRRRAQLAGVSDHRALSMLISHLETIRAAARTTPSAKE